jgi:type IV pilus assembly protein PilY1
MVTYGVSFGVTGTLDPATHDPATTPWPSPWAGDAQKIDDLYHSSVNGHGVFLSAGNPTELVDSLLNIMLDIKNRIGSASSVSVNGDELYKQIDDNTYMFQSSYDTVGWLGDIKSYKVDSLTGALDLTSSIWTASTVWQAEDWTTYWDTRSIVSYAGSAGVPFRIGSLDAAQETLLDPTPATAQLVLDYVRGDGSNEQFNGGTFRNRSSRLGDIVHSSPIYHNGILYVGANDGMMHAVRAEGTTAGSELFSYVPSQVIQNLSLLTDPAYVHNYYVDLTVTVEDNVLGANSTLLVGGLGQGGIGYYALDISNLSTYNSTTQLWQASAITEATAAGKVLWEFPHAGAAPTAAADISDIGYSFSKSLIVRTNDTTHPWVVIFGNGYNSVDGQSVLFILDPATGNVLRKFELGDNFDLNGDGDFDDAGEGLSTPSVTDVDGDGKADYVYAGDLAGNMWKIDLTDTSIASWDVAFNNGSIAPLFKATGPTGIDQPITSKPDVMYHPQYHGYLVAFGTGKFLGTSDFLDKTVQTVYGVWDYGDDTDDTENLGTFDPATRQISELSSPSTLLEQELLVPDFTYDPDATVTGDEEIVRVLTDNTIVWALELDSTAGELPNLSTTASNNAGWYFDLPNSGERVVSRMMIRDGKAIFISFTPENSPCTTGGDSILHEVDAADGGRMDVAVFDVNNDGVIDANDMIQVTDAAGNVITDAFGNAITVAVTGIQREGHLQTPAILKLGKEEIKYMSSTAGNIETVTETAVKTGISSWREF